MDLKLHVPKPLTPERRLSLGQGLINEFGKENVITTNPKIHIIQGRSGSIDVLPDQATYYPSHFKIDKLGARPFANNPTGRHAVRILKLEHGDLPGIKLERMVLAAQRRHPDIPLDRLYNMVNDELHINKNVRIEVL